MSGTGERRATQPGGVPGRSNAARLLPRAARAVARLQGLAVLPLLAAASGGPAAAQPTTTAAPGGDGYRTGLELVLRSRDGEATDARVARLAALHVPEGEAPSPFLDAGPFVASFRGAVELDLNDSLRFTVRGNGSVRLSIRGEVVLEQDALPHDGAAVSTDGAVRLRKGLNPIELVYRSAERGDTALRLSWSNDDLLEEPLPPASLRHAASPELDRGRARRRARNLVADAMCGRCHTSSRAPGRPMHGMPEAQHAAPDLDGVGSRLRRQWIERWLLDPSSLRARARMPRLLSADAALARQQAADLAAYLASTVTAAPQEEGAPPAPGDRRGPGGGQRHRQIGSGPPRGTPAAGSAVAVAVGRRLYARIGCAACHGDRTSPPRIDSAPRLIAPAEPAGATASVQPPRLRARWRSTALTAYLLDPTRFDPANRMPRTDLDAAEATALAAYLLAETPEDDTPPRSDSHRGDPQRGRLLADELRCRSCHALPEGGTPPTASPLDELAGRPEVWAAISASASGTIRHPLYDFTPPEVEAVERFLAEDAEAFSRTVSIEYAERRMRSGGCLACHARDGAPASWSPAAAVSLDPAAEGTGADTFTVSSAAMDADDPHQAPPDLTWAGEKLRRQWLEEYLGGRSADRPRPHLQVRMPTWPDLAEHLAAGMHHQHGLPATTPDPAPVDSELAAVGRSLVRSDRLGCVACHALGADPALGGEGSQETTNLDLVHRRLRRPWYDRFLHDPQRLLPGTKMPRFVDEDGYTALYDILDGKAASQFEAIWHYLGTLD